MRQHPRFPIRARLVGQTVDLDLPLAKAGAVELSTVTVTGTTATDRKTSEVGTNITPKQIDALPQNSRNFLAFADLAPGVRFDIDPKTGQSTLRGGAQNRDNANLFIDGVGQKNYILRGGLVGMDASSGNPFPQTAVAEYKVLSSNYKAETTRAGMNGAEARATRRTTSAATTSISAFQTTSRAPCAR